MQTICLHCGDHLLGFDLAHVCSQGPRAVKLKPKMNTQISELEAQCWESRQYGPDWFNSRKFAELIVQKCAKYAEHAKGTDVEFETYFKAMMFDAK